MALITNDAAVKALRDDEADMEWLRSHLQWKFGLVPGMKPFAHNLMGLIRQRFCLDIQPTPGVVDAERDVDAYLQHTVFCDARMLGVTRPCTCGLDDALARRAERRTPLAIHASRDSNQQEK